jgi:hypothetical protein
MKILSFILGLVFSIVMLSSTFYLLYSHTRNESSFLSVPSFKETQVMLCRNMELPPRSSNTSEINQPHAVRNQTQYSDVLAYQKISKCASEKTAEQQKGANYQDALRELEDVRRKINATYGDKWDDAVIESSASLWALRVNLAGAKERLKLGRILDDMKRELEGYKVDLSGCDTVPESFSVAKELLKKLEEFLRNVKELETCEERFASLDFNKRIYRVEKKTSDKVKEKVGFLFSSSGPESYKSWGFKKLKRKLAGFREDMDRSCPDVLRDFSSFLTRKINEKEPNLREAVGMKLLESLRSDADLAEGKEDECEEHLESISKRLSDRIKDEEAQSSRKRRHYLEERCIARRKELYKFCDVSECREYDEKKLRNLTIPGLYRLYVGMPERLDAAKEELRYLTTKLDSIKQDLEWFGVDTSSYDVPGQKISYIKKKVSEAEKALEQQMASCAR